jgi:hypothetical protein
VRAVSQAAGIVQQDRDDEARPDGPDHLGDLVE